MYGDLVMDSVPDKVMNNKITFPAIYSSCFKRTSGSVIYLILCMNLLHKNWFLSS